MILPPAERLQLGSKVVQATLTQEAVSGAPHTFYKYPARFSPEFASQVIQAFTAPGQTVLDPFCGGGTTIAEAMRLGRRSVGFDVSSLATFLTRAKTTPLSIHDRRAIQSWLTVVELLKIRVKDEPSPPEGEAAEEIAYYQKNLPEAARTYFQWVLSWLTLLTKPRQVTFVRLVLLSIGQSALDCKTELPDHVQLHRLFCGRLRDLLEEHAGYMTAVSSTNGVARCRLGGLRRVINRSAEGCGFDRRVPRSWLPAKLVLTSPPYPGMHVLYHRWQIQGRRETPAPFWLVGGRDGDGDSHYCMGSRKEKGLATYFDKLRRIFRAVSTLLAKDSLVVQLVAFSDAGWQLEEYLRVMGEAGFIEVLPGCAGSHLYRNRLWRNVPGRKWYAANGDQPTREVLLLHRPV